MRQPSNKAIELSPRKALIRLLARQIVAEQLSLPKVAGSGSGPQNHNSNNVIQLRRQ